MHNSVLFLRSSSLASSLAILCALLLSPLAGCGSGGGGGSTPTSDGESNVESGALSGSLTVGAHYYMWYPQNFAQGFLRTNLVPAQEPALGSYSSVDPRVAEQHIEWASSYGIDYFTLDWWPSRPTQNSAIDTGFLNARNILKIKFCIFYETIDLGFDPSKVTVSIDAAKRAKFVSDMKQVASKYFSHPSYLKVGGRPVIFLYVTRTLSGDYKGALEEARAELSKLGYSPFLIADEIYWSSSHNGASGVELLSEPNVERISLFDAITSYNTYAPGTLTHAGYGSESQHLADTSALYERYRDAAPDTPIVPGVLSGYNDRGHRLGLNHYVIPRRYSPTDISQGSFLREYIRQIGSRFADPSLNMIALTSWNEWNEDTAIEPIAPTAESAQDRLDSRFTQGFLYGGSGFEGLEVVAEVSR